MNYNKKTIGIIMGEPNSIFSELIFKIWKNRKKNKLIPFIFDAYFKNNVTMSIISAYPKLLYN